MSKILLNGHDAQGLLKFRLDLIRSWIAAGHKVGVVLARASDPQGQVSQQLADLGARVFAVRLDRTGANVAADIRYRQDLKRVMRDFQPDLMVAYGIKPMIFGLPIARAAGCKTAALVTGLGSTFDVPQGLRARVVGMIAASGLAQALRSADHIFFQNPDDRQELVARGLLDRKAACSQINGSGVNLRLYPQAPLSEPQDGGVIFVMIARLIRQKGILEYAAAAERLKARYPQARFLLAGAPDSNPNSMTLANLERFPAVERLGQVDDIPGLLARAHVFVLPSYYREGTPRSALEAMAVGRATILGDSPGTREPVIHEQTGLCVETRCTAALSQAMQRYLDQPSLCALHGAAAHQHARQCYDVHLVNEAMNQRLFQLLPAKSPLAAPAFAKATAQPVAEAKPLAGPRMLLARR